MRLSLVFLFALCLPLAVSFSQINYQNYVLGKLENSSYMYLPLQDLPGTTRLTTFTSILGVDAVFSNSMINHSMWWYHPPHQDSLSADNVVTGPLVGSSAIRFGDTNTTGIYLTMKNTSLEHTVSMWIRIDGSFYYGSTLYETYTPNWQGVSCFMYPSTMVNCQLYLSSFSGCSWGWSNPLLEGEWLFLTFAWNITGNVPNVDMYINGVLDTNRTEYYSFGDYSSSSSSSSPWSSSSSWESWSSSSSEGWDCYPNCTDSWSSSSSWRSYASSIWGCYPNCTDYSWSSSSSYPVSAWSPISSETSYSWEHPKLDAIRFHYFFFFNDYYWTWPLYGEVSNLFIMNITLSPLEILYLYQCSYSQSCATVDGVWSNFTVCNVNGTQFRTCTPPTFGGKDCIGESQRNCTWTSPEIESSDSESFFRRMVSSPHFPMAVALIVAGAIGVIAVSILWMCKRRKARTQMTRMIAISQASGESALVPTGETSSEVEETGMEEMSVFP